MIGECLKKLMRLQWMVEGEYEEIWWSGRGVENKSEFRVETAGRDGRWRRAVETGDGDRVWRRAVESNNM